MEPQVQILPVLGLIAFLAFFLLWLEWHDQHSPDYHSTDDRSEVAPGETRDSPVGKTATSLEGK